MLYLRNGHGLWMECLLDKTCFALFELKKAKSGNCESCTIENCNIFISALLFSNRCYPRCYSRIVVILVVILACYSRMPFCVVSLFCLYAVALRKIGN